MDTTTCSISTLKYQTVSDAVNPATQTETGQAKDNQLAEYVEHDDEEQKPEIVQTVEKEDDTKEIRVEGDGIKEDKEKI